MFFHVFSRGNKLNFVKGSRFKYLKRGFDFSIRHVAFFSEGSWVIPGDNITKLRWKEECLESFEKDQQGLVGWCLSDSQWLSTQKNICETKATEPRQTMMQVEFLKTAGFQAHRIIFFGAGFMWLLLTLHGRCEKLLEIMFYDVH
jgi:hypothetical protein